MADQITPPTPEEIEEIKGYATRLAGKAVLTHLYDLVSGSPALAQRVQSLITTEVNPLVLSTTESNVKINVGLLPTPRGFRAEILVPAANYAAAMYQSIHQVLAMAIAFWSQFSADHGELVAECSATLGYPLVLTVDKSNPNSLWFSPAAAGKSECVSIVCYYTENGKPIIPNKKGK
jgi:hypothetical protein